MRVWSWQNGLVPEMEFFAFDASETSGMVGVVHDGNLSLIQQQTSTPIFKTFSLESLPKTLQEKRLTLSVAGTSSLFLHQNILTLATTEGVRTLDDQLVSGFAPTLSANIAVDATHLIFSPVAPSFINDTSPKRIVVDISDQRLFAYEQGTLTNTFLISSGRYNTTPLGEHQVLAKLPLVHYAWFYGAGSPNNYDLGWVPYNLRFFPHIYIHYAPWHNNFGHPMSRGCVNVSLSNMKWIYDWGEVGIPVRVQS